MTLIKASGFYCCNSGPGIDADNVEGYGGAAFGRLYPTGFGNTWSGRKVQGPAVFALPWVSGLFLRVNWSQLEAADGVYTWAVLDKHCNALAATGKKLSLGIVAGSGCPTWMAAGGAYGPAAMSNHRAIPTGGGTGGAATPQIMTWFDPRDVAYQQYVARLAQQLYDHMATTPTTTPGVMQLDVLSFVKVAGINRTGSELRMPAHVGYEVAQDGKHASADIAWWSTNDFAGGSPAVAAGGGYIGNAQTGGPKHGQYTASSMFAAWKTIAAAWHNVFTNVNVGVSIVTSASFPDYGTTGTSASVTLAPGDTGMTIGQQIDQSIEYCLDNWGDRFLPGYNAIDDGTFGSQASGSGVLAAYHTYSGGFRPVYFQVNQGNWGSPQRAGYVVSDGSHPDWTDTAQVAYTPGSSATTVGFTQLCTNLLLAGGVYLEAFQNTCRGYFEQMQATAGQLLTAVTVTPATGAYHVGATAQLAAVAVYADGTTATVTSGCTYSSSNPSAVTVTNGGLMTMVGPGAATISVSYTAGYWTPTGVVASPAVVGSVEAVVTLKGAPSAVTLRGQAPSAQMPQSTYGADAYGTTYGDIGDTYGDPWTDCTRVVALTDHPAARVARLI